MSFPTYGAVGDKMTPRRLKKVNDIKLKVMAMKMPLAVHDTSPVIEEFYKKNIRVRWNVDTKKINTFG